MWKTLIAIILGLIGLGLLGWALYESWKTGRVRTWPKTNAQVLAAGAEQVEGGSNTLLDPESIPLVDNNAVYKARVRYVYNVGPRQYTSENFMQGKEYFNAQEIKTLMAPVRAGQQVPVFYNPDNAEEAYIYDAAGTNWAGIWWGVGFIVASILFFIWAGADKKKHTSFDSVDNISLDASPSKLQRELNNISQEKINLNRSIASGNEVRADYSRKLNYLNTREAAIERSLATGRANRMGFR